MHFDTIIKFNEKPFQTSFIKGFISLTNNIEIKTTQI